MYVIWISLCMDIGIIFLSLLISTIVRFGDALFLKNSTAVLFILIASPVLGMSVFGAYKKRFVSLTHILKSTLLGIVTGVLMSFSTLYAFRINFSYVPSSILLLSSIISFVLISSLKMAFYKVSGRIFRKVRFVKHDDVVKIDSVLLRDIDEIVLTDKDYEFGQISRVIELCKQKGVKLSILPKLYEKMIMQKLDYRENIRVFPAYLGDLTDTTLIKIFDFVFSLMLLFLLMPFILLICLLIKIDTPGPIIFKQKRIGRHGEVFTIYKFRSMVKNAGQFSSNKQTSFKRDTRVTKFGRIMRQTRIDEIPQLINVLKGDMRLVGPRPEAVYRVKEHQALKSIRLSVKPGLTGLAQIQGDYFTHPRHKSRYDYIYIKNRSLGFNLWILLKTCKHILTNQGS